MGLELRDIECISVEEGPAVLLELPESLWQNPVQLPLEEVDECCRFTLLPTPPAIGTRGRRRGKGSEETSAELAEATANGYG
jgi:hypothetical protein